MMGAIGIQRSPDRDGGLLKNKSLFAGFTDHAVYIDNTLHVQRNYICYQDRLHLHSAHTHKHKSWVLRRYDTFVVLGLNHFLNEFEHSIATHLNYLTFQLIYSKECVKDGVPALIL